MSHNRANDQRTGGRRTVKGRRRRSMRPTVMALEDRRLLATFMVNLTTDTAPTTGGSGSGNSGDLRYCITQADANNQANTIVFDSTVFATAQTITLGGSQLELSDTGGTQTITGPAAGVTISAGRQSRVFQVDSGVTASITGLTITGGSTATNGGGLYNHGTATLIDCTVSGNDGLAATFGKGGGLYSNGVLTTHQSRHDQWTTRLRRQSATPAAAAACPLRARPRSPTARSAATRPGTRRRPVQCRHGQLTDCTAQRQLGRSYGGGVYEA